VAEKKAQYHHTPPRIIRLNDLFLGAKIKKEKEKGSGCSADEEKGHLLPPILRLRGI